MNMNNWPLWKKFLCPIVNTLPAYYIIPAEASTNLAAMTGYNLITGCKADNVADLYADSRAGSGAEVKLKNTFALCFKC